MARLPQPGQDAGQWGNLLNDFLSTTHDSNGNFKDGSVTTAALAASSVTLAKLAISSSPSTGQALTYDGTGLTWSTITGSGVVPDASTSAKGLVQLTGDLGGTAAAPTVPGLASKANTSDLAAKANTTDVVALAGTQTVTGAKNFTGGLQSSGVAVVVNTDARLTDSRTPADGSVSTAKIVDSAITEPKLAISNLPTTSQVLSWNGAGLAWANPTSGGSGDPTMGGDLSGVASNAQIVANAVTTTEVIDNAITEPKLAISNIAATNNVLSWNGSALTWVTPSSTVNGVTVSGAAATGKVLTATSSSAATWSTPASSGAFAWNINQFTPTGVNSPVYPVNGDWLIIDNSTNSTRVFLPAVSAANDKILIKLKTVSPTTGSQAIVFVGDINSYPDPSSGTALTLNPTLSAAEFKSDGTNWYVMGRYDS